MEQSACRRLFCGKCRNSLRHLPHPNSLNRLIPTKNARKAMTMIRNTLIGFLILCSQSPTVPASTPNEDRKLYLAECGACHKAYPGQLMTTKSWSKLLTNLKSHFGHNAEITDPKIMKAVNRHLTEASKVNDANPKPFTSASARISDTPQFHTIHQSIPEYLWTSTKVHRPSNCDACHTDGALCHATLPETDAKTKSP
jgi:polyferredoxin